MPNDEFGYYAFIFSVITHTNLKNMLKGPWLRRPNKGIYNCLCQICKNRHPNKVVRVPFALITPNS